MPSILSKSENMKRSEPYQEIVSHLENLSELFTIPTPDPFSAQVRFVPEIETIKATLARNPLDQRRKARITIFLPKDCMKPDLAKQIHEAIRRYCLFKSQQNHYGMTALRRDALQALLVGILFLAGGLFFSGSIGRIVVLPPFFQLLFSDGFDIAFWVILWRPVDFFLFEASAFWREDRLNKRLMEMEVVVSDNTF